MKTFARKLLFLLPLICLLIIDKTYAANSYSLVTSGLPDISGDQRYIVPLLQKNKLFSENSVYTFTYDVNAKLHLGGTTVSSYKNAIQVAYRDSTKNDMCFFFHSGHGSALSDKTPGLGLELKWGGLQYYSYNTLLSDLAKINCKHMIVWIHACQSGAVMKAWKKLNYSQKQKISVFWSSDSTAPSYYKDNSKKLSFYGLGLFTALGGLGTVNSDLNGDGNVNVSELGLFLNRFVSDYVSTYYKATQQPGYISYNPLLDVFSDKSTQSLKLNMGKTSIYPGEKISLKAAVKGENKKVIWSSSNSRVASVSGKGKVTGIKAGTAIITAKAGSKSATCQVTVLDPNVRLSNENLTIIRGKTGLLKLTYGGPSQKVTWKSSNKKIATVNKKGIVTGKRAGKVTITVTVNKVKKTCVVTVKDPYVTISSKALSLTKGAKYKLSAATNGKSNKFTWKSSKSKVASIDKYGNVTAKRPGTAIITVKANGKQASCTVTVRAVELKLSLDRTSLNLNVGSSSTLKATVTGGSGKVSWTTSNNKIATVSAGGSVKAIAEGKATITATIDGKKASCSVTVNKVTAKATDYRDVSNYLGQRLKQVAAGMKLQKVTGNYSQGIAFYSVTGSKTGYNSFIGAYSYGVADDSLWWCAVIEDQSFNIYGLRVGTSRSTVYSTLINNGWKKVWDDITNAGICEDYTKGCYDIFVNYANDKAIEFQIESHTDIKHPG